MTTDTSRTDAEITKEAKIVKLTKQNYHGLAKSKKVWYETMKKIRGIYEETETPRTDAETYVWQDGGENPFVHRDFARQLESELAASKAEVERLAKRPFGCKCETLREKVLGDGCDECNKALVIEMLTDERDELEAEVERLKALPHFHHESYCRKCNEPK